MASILNNSGSGRDNSVRLITWNLTFHEINLTEFRIECSRIKELNSNPLILFLIQMAFVIVTCTLFQTQVLLVNIYAPYWDDVDAMNRILSSLPNLNIHQLIFGRDLNCVVDPVLDHSESGYVDPWRYRNPLLKALSFFSHVHHTFS